ncbi:MAG: tRNA (cytidine(56)-2'-O)-methyltransferase [Desulfurococcales archaeon]|jgi:tRNA (cytidine56-2'-O)-methyltransferase|nr:tRNA (cytidine(56)-2'-O)-methyltransferase [Desulfurococcales archaeon]
MVTLLRKDLGYRVYVLRLGHRVGRDKRVSTHVGLVARAFGASGIIYAGDEDREVISSIIGVIDRWGGDGFEVSYTESWRRTIEEWRKGGGCIVHLTMYGIPVDDAIDQIRTCKDLLVIIGSEKVPREVYELSDYNISIGSQPHSEVAALAIFLDRLFRGEELRIGYTDARIVIVPSPRGKYILNVENIREEKTHHSS